MNYAAVIAAAIREWPCAREFQRLFSNAEHIIVEALRNFDPDGWKPVHEWISRAHMHDRYVVWLVTAIEIAADGGVAELEKPELCVVKVEKVERSRDDEDGPRWECGFFQFEEGDWQQLVDNREILRPLGYR